MLFSETVLTKSFPIPAAVKPEEKKNLLAEKPEFKPIFFFLHSREICTRNWRKINHVRVLFGVNLISLTSYLAEVEYSLQWRLLGDGDSCCFKKTK